MRVKQDIFPTNGRKTHEQTGKKQQLTSPCLKYYEAPTKERDSWARPLHGVRIYVKKAVLDHLLNVWIVESWMPAADAEVAAPILNLWLEYRSQGMPALARALRMLVTQHAFVKGVLSLKQKKGPEASPWTAT